MKKCWRHTETFPFEFSDFQVESPTDELSDKSDNDIHTNTKTIFRPSSIPVV